MKIIVVFPPIHTEEQRKNGQTAPLTWGQVLGRADQIEAHTSSQDRDLIEKALNFDCGQDGSQVSKDEIILMPDDRQKIEGVKKWGAFVFVPLFDCWVYGYITRDQTFNTHYRLVKLEKTPGPV